MIVLTKAVDSYRITTEIFTMKQKSFLTPFAIAAILCATSAIGAAERTISAWQVDACEKVFSDALPPSDVGAPQIVASAATNEYESAQLAVRSSADVDAASASVSDLAQIDGDAKIPAKNARVRVVGTIPIGHNTPLAEPIVTRKAPCDMPDVLYETQTFDLKANESKSLWITFYVPQDVPAGVYEGELTLSVGEETTAIPIKLEVFPFALPSERHLFMTNWWSPGNIANWHKLDRWTDPYWEILDHYFADMAEHRQNVIFTPWSVSPNDLVLATLQSDGTWSFDLSRLEKLLDLAHKNGVDERIELSHIGNIDRVNHVVRYEVATIYDEKTKEWRASSVDEWLEPCLKAICNLLRERGAFDRAMIHIADEPYILDNESWREASERVHKIEPNLKRIDAIETINFTNRLEVWVPKLSHFDRWRSAFEQRRGQGEFWYYICCHPFGVAYPNRFMDLPGARVRTLHWLNYSESLVGYLHWGYNYWRGDPFGPPTTDYGPGDTHCVYPGDGGPLDSIRWELQRESVEDYEYLKLLEASVAKIKAEKDPEKGWFIDPRARSMELARRVVPDLKRATIDFNVINATRRELANEIAATTGPVKLVVQTFPEDGSTTALGPALHELYGSVAPGALVTINGESQSVSEDGFFKKQLNFGAGTHVVEIVASLNGQTAKTTRTFVVE